ncbi:MFS transporter [Bacillus niameyensis]|uniref:MFS transporter n=1 Tax=Bacillus niameyensis TaxID=1522308 RepID=UPI000782B4AC|nr:MFS transporter [Bacillus niameyensis]
MMVIANLFVFMSFQMLIPTLPPYVKSLGASGFEIGMITTMFSIGAVLIRPFIGYLLEFSKRRHLVLIGSAALLFMTIMYPLSQIVMLLLLLRLLHGIMWGWSTTVNGTAAVDIVPNNRIGEGIGYFGLSITIGMIMAPSLGIYIYQHFDFNAVIIISAVLGCIAFVLLSLIHFETPQSVKNIKKADIKFSFFGSLIERNSWYPAFVTLMATFGYGTIVTFIVIFAEERKIEQIFVFYLMNALMATLIRPFTGRWFDKRGPKGLVILCSILAFVGMWVLSFSFSWVGILVTGIIFGAGYGSLIPALQSWVLAKTPKLRRGVANGMYYSAIDLGIGLSGLVFGIFAKFLAINYLFQISSSFFLIVIIFTVCANKKQFSMYSTD